MLSSSAAWLLEPERCSLVTAGEQPQLNEFLVTLDVDWAPDFVIDDVADLLVAAGVKATWFITHSSAAVERLRQRGDLFELGIHPNFLPGSSHGNTPRDVLDHVLSIVPDALSSRSHAVFQSAPILKLLLDETPIRVDSSVLLPESPHIRPVPHRIGNRSLLRVPVFWADDYALANLESRWSIERYIPVAGCKTMDFHPIHVYLNTAEMRAYDGLKTRSRQLTTLRTEDAAPFRNAGVGVRTMFRELLDRLAFHGASRCLRDLHGGSTAAH